MVPRHSLFWLLLAQVLVIAPLLWHVPLWLAGLWAGCALWRLRVYHMRARFPGTLIKLALMLGAGFGVFVSRGSLVGLDAGVALLVTAFILKLVELRSRRDALVLVFLGFFTLVTSYLYDDSLLAALYSLLPVSVLLTAWSGLQQAQAEGSPLRAWRAMVGLLLQVIPLAVLLFVFFPRLEPLWSLPQPGDRGVTGLSEQMSPGDIAELSQSSALAFRARFEGEIPPRQQLYWRALTLPHFDGRSWRRGRPDSELRAPVWQPRGDAQSYEVVMQPSHQPWLFSLAVSDSDSSEVRLLSDLRLQRSTPVHRTWLYRAQVWPQALAEPQMTGLRQRQFLQLPSRSNPRTRRWITEMRAQHTTDAALVQAVLRHFNEQPYHYTLKPPRLGEHSVDEFLFDTQRGFCEHYAGAMTFALRAAGVPARVVTGYQGGEINVAGNFVQVRQLDAHAWVEYWQSGQGWLQVDPTFQVAPERIELGLEEALLDERDLLDMGRFSALNYRHLAWVNQLRNGWENLNHQWQSSVLGYQRDRQEAWLKRWFGSLDWQRIGMVLVAALAAVLSFLALWLLKPWRERPTFEQRLLQKLAQVLQRVGLEPQPGEGLRHLLERSQSGLSREAFVALTRLTQLLELHLYAGRPQSREKLQKQLSVFARAVRQQSV